jgi:enamine deaminase RidA (YjgF/YER057c/UK114 family)
VTKAVSKSGTKAKTPPLKMIDPDAIEAGIEVRLTKLGITLPVAAAPVAAYVPAVEASGLLHVSGQLPFKDGHVMVGRAGSDRTTEFAQEAARACGLMLLAQVKATLGSLDRVERVVKLNVFVNSDPRFTEQPKVANGASELMVEVFGDAGRHARAAVGVAALPLDAVVEADAVFAVKPA